MAFTRAAWLQWGHGRSAVEIAHCRSPAGRPKSGASMGPRPFSRGNHRRARASPPRRSGLQWGHGRSAVEMAHSAAARPKPGFTASMGPRPFSRGNDFQQGAYWFEVT